MYTHARTRSCVDSRTLRYHTDLLTHTGQHPLITIPTYRSTNDETVEKPGSSRSGKPAGRRVSVSVRVPVPRAGEWVNVCTFARVRKRACLCRCSQPPNILHRILLRYLLTVSAETEQMCQIPSPFHRCHRHQEYWRFTTSQ